jgi:hypothetical protein
VLDQWAVDLWIRCFMGRMPVFAQTVTIWQSKKCGHPREPRAADGRRVDLPTVQTSLASAQGPPQSSTSALAPECTSSQAPVMDCLFNFFEKRVSNTSFASAMKTSRGVRSPKTPTTIIRYVAI